MARSLGGSPSLPRNLYLQLEVLFDPGVLAGARQMPPVRVLPTRTTRRSANPMTGVSGLNSFRGSMIARPREAATVLTTPDGMENGSLHTSVAQSPSPRRSGLHGPCGDVKQANDMVEKSYQCRAWLNTKEYGDWQQAHARFHAYCSEYESKT